MVRRILLCLAKALGDGSPDGRSIAEGLESSESVGVESRIWWDGLDASAVSPYRSWRQYALPMLSDSRPVIGRKPLSRNKTFLNRVLGQRPIAHHAPNQVVGLGLVGFKYAVIAGGLLIAALHR